MMRSKLNIMTALVIATSISTFVAADWNAGMAAFKARDYRTAAAEFAEAAHDHPDYAGCYYMLGMCRMQLRDLALEYGLLSKYTAFLAVDSRSKTAGDHGVTVHQAVPVPDGVRYETTVAEHN